jgi:hypothetical protein
VNMEGPAFSTVAESHLYRSWNGQVIGMTALAEAKLAREAEMSYVGGNLIILGLFFFFFFLTYVYTLIYFKVCRAGNGN